MGGFPLRKWAASHTSLLSLLPIEWLAEKPIKHSLASPNHPLLGLIYNPSTDDFSFSADYPELSNVIAKRQVLSIVAKL